MRRVSSKRGDDQSLGDELSIRVLLVEDNVGDAELVRVLLRGAPLLDVEVEVEQTLRDALTRLTKEGPELDVILTDLNLPDSDGMRTLRKLLKTECEAPVVVFTGGDPALGQHAIREGAQDFVRKGSDGDTLARVLRFAVLRADHQRTVVEYERRLIHSDRLAALGQLAAGVSHEINNPASYIGTNLDQLRELVVRIRAGDLRGEALKAAADEMITMIDDSREGFRHIKAITRDLRSFARVSRDAVELTDVNEAVRSAVNLTGVQLRHVARLELDLDDISPIPAERAKIVQIFVNLLINAAQAIAEQGTRGHRIGVRSRREEEAIVVEVSDDGPGIPPEVCGRIFEPFYTTKPADRGTGLGLAVCRDCVEVHHGTIEVESEPGQGTTFRVTLPLDTGLQVASVPSPRATGAFSPERARVLLVDDDRMVRRSLKRSLAHHCDVVEAQGGADAIQMLAEDDAFDVVLCDLMMPDVDGAEVLAWLEAERPSLVPRVIFISGGAFTARGRAVLDRGCRVLGKPIDDGELFAAVQDTVSRHHGR